MISRRRFLLAAAGAATGIGGLAYARRIEPRWLDITEKTLALPAGTWAGPPLRVVHLSDLHLSDPVPLALIDEAVTRTIALRPDAICVTGDFVTAAQDFDEVVYTPVLARLAAAAPTFATLGNHDGGVYHRDFKGQVTVARVGAMLLRAGLAWLHNRAATLTVRGRPVHLVGLGDWWSRQCLPALAFHRFAPIPGAPILALSHNPDSKDALRLHPWHVLLSGHTHGGQCGVPLLGPALAPVQDKHYIAGAYRYADRWLHITRGVGNLHGVRLFCRPEVSLLTLA